MRHPRISWENYSCTVCFYWRRIPRVNGQRREKHHPKALFCPKCSRPRIFLKR